MLKTRNGLMMVLAASMTLVLCSCTIVLPGNKSSSSSLENSSSEQAESSSLSNPSSSLSSCESASSSDNVYEVERQPMVPVDGYTPSIDLSGYKLAWHDEFDYIGQPNSASWGYDIGNGSWGWGNNEKQYYTDSSSNAYCDGNNLTITAKKEEISGYSYSSARLVTKNKADFLYGYIEISAKLPSTAGTWPALWMLPTANVYGGWPYSGEMDIMEMTGTDKNSVLGTFHTGHYNWSNGAESAKGSSIANSNTADRFNLYQILWTEDYASIMMNDSLIYRFSRDSSRDGDSDAYMYWPFDQEFHLIFNIAMGGTLGGSIPGSFDSDTMVVDYVRVYQSLGVEGDTEAPSKTMVSSKKNIDSTSMKIKWKEASDNVGINHYEVALNGTTVYSTVGLEATLTGLEENTPYQVNIIAVDYFGNYSIGNPIILWS